MTARPLSWTVRMALVYVILLTLLATYGLNSYGHLAEATVPGDPMDEGHALYEDFRSYGRFLMITSLMLGAFLGLFAAHAGLRRQRTSVGLAVLALGVLVTVIPYSLLPYFYYPGDSLPAWRMWLNTGFYGYGIAWFAGTLAGQVNRSRGR